MSANDEIRNSLENSGVKREITDLLLSLFPSGSFKEHLPLFREAIEKPESLRKKITQFELKSGIGAVSHIAIVERELLGLNKFPMFTRDYIKRCGDLVELFVKTRLLDKLPSCKPNKSLGNIIHTMQSQYSTRIPKELLDALKSFDLSIYRPAKHKFVGTEMTLFTVPDAVATTLIALKLCQQIENISKSL
jgi:hypothetical protein